MSVETKKRLLVVMGTRPEAIKLAPVVLGAQAQSVRFDVQVVRTSQHQEMLDQIVNYFGLPIAADLDIMRPDQNLVHITNAALDGLFRAIDELSPDVVIVQGDTTTTFAGALAAFYHQIPVAHIEAGLRTYDKRQPFPEEVNRCLTTQLTDYHFAPTEGSKRNLLREGITEDRIWVTGNTAIDTLFLTLDKAGEQREPDSGGEQTILLTAHRRENHGDPMREICDAVLTLMERFPKLRVVYPVHLSPRVREVVFPLLGGHPRVQLLEPLDYEPFVLAMSQATLILTDSGGVQEEAPALGKPVLVMRNTTERPEAVDAGTAKLVGTSKDVIVSEVSRLLSDSEHHRAMAQARNPYGDGHASERILDVLAGVGGRGSSVSASWVAGR
jgi:UDP-N-acetylglucosamine 2-epimerase (non-hydrolysing)